MKKPMIIYIEDDWGTSYRDALLLYLKQKGFGDVPVQGITANNRDFRIQVEKVKASAPDSIFLLLYAKDGASFMQQLRQAGVKAVVYGSDNISSSEFVSAGSEVVEGVRVALPAPVTGPAFDEFTNKFRAKFGEEPDANVIKSYDAMNLAVSVIKQVGTEPSKIKSFLHSPSFQYQGISGLIKFDEHGDLVHQEYSRLIYQSGKLLPR